jgi:NAD(P)H dehydrogenase (quinone)
MNRLLITGATGHLGKAVINFLLKKGTPASQITALVRDEAKAADLKEKGIELRKGDYHDYASLVKAFTGIDKLLLVSSADINDRSSQHINAVNAAKEAGVKHILYTSVQSRENQPSAIPFVVQSHFDTERAIKNSGISYTILRNTIYADMLPMFLGEKVAETGVFIPAGKGKTPFATREDMAEAAASVLITPGHENKVYPITSPTGYSFTDIAASLSELSGKNIPYVDATPEQYKETLSQAGVPQEYIGVMAGFAEAMKQNEFDEADNTLESLLGRKPTSLKEYLKSIYFTTNN